VAAARLLSEPIEHAGIDANRDQLAPPADSAVSGETARLSVNTRPFSVLPFTELSPARASVASAEQRCIREQRAGARDSNRSSLQTNMPSAQLRPSTGRSETAAIKPTIAALPRFGCDDGDASHRDASS